MDVQKSSTLLLNPINANTSSSSQSSNNAPVQQNLSSPLKGKEASSSVFDLGGKAKSVFGIKPSFKPFRSPRNRMEAPVGRMIELGKHDPDYIDPVKLFRKVKIAAWQRAQEGDYEYTRHLAVLYGLGSGTRKDPEMALKLMKRAARGGDAYALGYMGSYYMGEAHQKGPIDYKKAFFLLKASIDRGKTNCSGPLNEILIKFPEFKQYL